MEEGDLAKEAAATQSENEKDQPPLAEAEKEGKMHILGISIPHWNFSAYFSVSVFNQKDAAAVWFVQRHLS